MADGGSSDGKSYYALLGVSPTASEDEIKRAYRQLATTLHPDKVANSAHHDEAARLFTQIQEAYEVGAGLPSHGQDSRCSAGLLIVLTLLLHASEAAPWCLQRTPCMHHARPAEAHSHRQAHAANPPALPPPPASRRCCNVPPPLLSH